MVVAASSLLDKGLFSEAYPLLKEGERINPREYTLHRPFSYYFLAEADYYKNEAARFKKDKRKARDLLKKAVEAYQNALRKDPSNDYARKNLEQLKELFPSSN